MSRQVAGWDTHPAVSYQWHVRLYNPEEPSDSSPFSVFHPFISLTHTAAAAFFFLDQVHNPPTCAWCSVICGRCFSLMRDERNKGAESASSSKFLFSLSSCVMWPRGTRCGQDTSTTFKPCNWFLLPAPHRGERSWFMKSGDLFVVTLLLFSKGHWFLLSRRSLD